MGAGARGVRIQVPREEVGRVRAGGVCVIRLSVKAPGSARGTFSEPHAQLRASLSGPRGCCFLLCCVARAAIADLIKMKTKTATWED